MIPLNVLVEHTECWNCPLEGRPPVGSYGTKDAKYIFIGEAPGEDEIRTGQLFTGKSGRMLRTVIEGVGINLSEVYITNSCLCRPVDNATPGSPAISACNSRLKFELESIPDAKIMPLGATALTALGISDSISQIRGRYLLHNGRMVLPTYHPAYLLRQPGLFRDFVEDVGKLTRDPGWVTYPEFFDPPKPYIAENYDECKTLLEECYRKCQRSKLSIIDLETGPHIPKYCDILSLGISPQLSPCEAYIFPWFIIASYSDLFSLTKRIIEDPRCRWGAHNVGFEHGWLSYVFQTSKINWKIDTMLAHYAVDERSGGDVDNDSPAVSGSYHNLKLLAGLYYDVPDWSKTIRQYTGTKGDFTKIPRDILYKYQVYDLIIPQVLAQDLTDEMREDNVLSLHDDLLLPAAQVIAEIEQNGILIDQEYLYNLGQKWLLESQRSLQKIKDDYDLDDFNLNSWRQVGYLLYDLMGLPQIDGRKTGEEVLNKLYEITQDTQLKDLLVARSQLKLKGTYVDGILKRLDPDGRIRTALLLFGTATGRLASRDPNLQNIPAIKGPEVRRAFIADPGWKIGDADYATLELRCWAYYSKDPDLTQMFLRGHDIHNEVALAITGKTNVSEITKYERDMAKCLNFGIPYGREVDSVIDQLGLLKKYKDMGLDPTSAYKMAREEGQSYIDDYLARFPVGAKWLYNQRLLVDDPGYCVSNNGRKRRFPYISSRNRGDCERQAINSPIQAMASDICLKAAMKLHREVFDPAIARGYLLVHDSFVFGYDEDFESEILPLAKTVMEDVGLDTEIPFIVDMKCGPNWGDVKTWTAD